MSRLLLCILLLAAIAQARHEKYEGHQLYRVAGPVEKLAKLEAHLDVLSATPASRSSSGKLEVLVKLAPEEKEEWFQYFKANKMAYRLIISNLATVFRNEEEQIESNKLAARRKGIKISWDTYYRHDKINNYLDELAVEYPNLVTVINAGLTYEGRQIKYAMISTTSFNDDRKPVIIIDAAIHAREWIATPVALYIIHQLVVDRADNSLTNGIDWIIIPCVNPDGYEYSFDVDRLWRKTRSKSHAGSGACPGVDGNRNFDHYWGTRVAAQNPCSITYEGPSVFSEAETRVIRNVVLNHIQRAALYLTIHNFGNMFLYAWGQNGSLPNNGLTLHLVGNEMAEAIDEKAYKPKKRYTVGNAAQVLYSTTGTSRDWTRAVGIPLTYTLELPGYDFGHEVPPEYIKQVVTETWAGIVAGGKHVMIPKPRPCKSASSASSLRVYCSNKILLFSLSITVTLSLVHSSQEN